MITGGVVDIVWNKLSGGIFDIYEIIPGFICATITILIVSLVTTPSEEMFEEFNMVGDEID